MNNQYNTYSISVQDPTQILAMITILLQNLTVHRRAVLKEIFYLLYLVSLESSYNLMDSKNLATIFGL